MCGRYYVDDETAREIEKLVRQVDRKLRQALKGLQRRTSIPLRWLLFWKGGAHFCAVGGRGGDFPGFRGSR